MNVLFPVLIIAIGLVVLALGKKLAVMGAAVGALLGVVLLRLLNIPLTDVLLTLLIPGLLAVIGFFVAGLSGKTRIQILPPRLTERVMARRAASIWRLVIQAGSRVARPNSPNATVVPPFAWPDIRPRWTLRCLTRRGINMATPPARPRSEP